MGNILKVLGGMIVGYGIKAIMTEIGGKKKIVLKEETVVSEMDTVEPDTVEPDTVE